MTKKNILLIPIILFLALAFAIRSIKFPLYKFDASNAYDFYKQNYLLKEGRVIDSSRGNITTSEGQAYILYMSLAMDDRKTFDLVYNWTNKHLRRKDGLFSWIWGKNNEGKYKILDNNSAADADIDLTRSSLLAYEIWKDKKYLKNGLQSINGIWNNETRQIGKYLVLMPGPAQAKSNFIEVNPSYFAPYAFKVFKKYDPKHDWDKLVDSSYYYLKAATAKTKTGLPPNWFLIENEQVVLEDSERSDFSYDAIRVFWRIYFDYQKTGEKRALPVLEKSKFFIEKWKKSKNFYVNYQSNGKLRDKNKFVGAIAILLPAITLYDKKVAAEIYKNEVAPYNGKDGYWDEKHQYYAKNLLWFGQYMYVYNKLLK